MNARNIDRKRVVIVDDSATMRAMLSGVLADDPRYDVVGVARDAQEALDLVARVAPAIVIIDLIMPYIDGSKLLSLLGDRPRLTKVILSGRSDELASLEERLLSFGASALFNKKDIAQAPELFRKELFRLAEGKKPKPAAADRGGAANVIYAADRFPVPANEAERLKAVAALGIANLDPDPGLDIIARHLAKATGFPLAAVNILDAERVWTKAIVGLERQAFPRGHSLCAYALCHDGPLVIFDALAHPTLRKLPTVTGAPHVRAYVGVPIISRHGMRLGVICMADVQPRRASRAEITSLTEAAKLATEFLEEQGGARRAA